MVHQDGAKGVYLEILGAGHQSAHGKEESVCRAGEGLMVRRVGGPAAVLFRHLGDAELGVGDLELGEKGETDVDDFVPALGGEVIERLVAQFPHGGIGLVEPVSEDAHDTLCGRRRGQGECEAALRRTGCVGLGHDAVGNGQVGDVCGDRARDAHGHLHDVGAVVGGLEAVDAVKVGRDADAAAGVRADGDGDDAGSRGGTASVG